MNFLGIKYRPAGVIMAVTMVFTLTLGACGFKPMHAPGAFGGNSVNLSNIKVQMLANEKLDFILAQALRDRMGDNSNTAYTLRILSEARRAGLGIGADDVASRFDVVMTTNFELVDAKTGDIVYRGNVRAISTYGAPADPYGSLVAQNNAEMQAATETADRIIAKLAGYQASYQADSETKPETSSEIQDNQLGLVK